ncbi:hypothetical protein FRX31_008168 [Thalictrum thalictroides]|uniref:Uncharacterized protein n=1 Tax=Thalictrum thalictroides TaxID=46969 RepID=A0A7J6X089_THATH|nr:hypothetical protein FRX31_008168 [Thalictrum thalictroides]
MEGEASGAKDSNGNEIPSQLQPVTDSLPTQNIHQAKSHVTFTEQAGVTSDNPFSVLEDLEEEDPPINGCTENPNPSINEYQQSRDKAPLEPILKGSESQNTTCIEEEVHKNEAAIIPALAQLYPSQPSDQFQGVTEQLQYKHLSGQIPTNLLLLQNDDTDPEEENDIEENQALVTYGSDTEITCKPKKPIPPLTMLTRSKTQGSASSSKKGYQCCKD